METPDPAAPPPAAPSATPPAQSNVVHPISGPLNTLVVAENQPQAEDAGRGGLPMDLDQIDGLFTGTGTIDVPNTAIEGAPPATPPPVVAPPVVPPVELPAGTPPPVVPAVGTPVVPAAPPAVAPAVPDAVARAMALQQSINGSKQPGDAGYVKLSDAITRIEEADAPAPVAPKPDLVAAAATTVSTIETDLAALKEQRKALGDDGSFYGPKVVEIQDAIEAKLAELGEAKGAHKSALSNFEREQQQQQQSVAQQEVAARKGAMTRAAAEFPTAAVKTSPLGARVTQLVEQMTKPGHPDHAVLFSTNAAMHVTQAAAVQVATEMAAASNGAMTFAQAFDSLRAPAAATPPATPAPEVETEHRRVSPVTGSSGTLPPAPQPTEAQIMAASLDDPDLADRILYGSGERIFVLK